MSKTEHEPEHGHVHLPAPGANPILVEVTRGPMVESVHRGRAAVLDGAGKVVFSWGDFEAPVYPRSAVKPLQAIPLLETGAAEACNADDGEIAIACASHGGEERHVATVARWLTRLGLTEADLECGTHWPSHEPSARALARAGRTPSALHNNCSGKHTGMLATALHRGEPTRGYVHANHPVQQRVMGVLEQVCGVDLGAAPRGVEGCAIPTFGIPLGNLAYGFARFADPRDLPEDRAMAVRRIARAMTAHPFLVAGTDRYCTLAMQAASGRLLVKTGAEGVFCAALPELGLGVALKCDDGARRGAEAMMSAVLARLGVLDEDLAAVAAARSPVPVCNCAGETVGEVRSAAVPETESGPHASTGSA